MSQIEIAEAISDLHGLVERAHNGEEVVLVDRGRQVARIVPLGEPPKVYQPVQLGRLSGKFKVPDDFDAPLPDDLLDLFEGRA